MERSAPSGTVIGARVPIARLRPHGDDPELLFPVEPKEPLVVDQIALPPEQNMQTSIAERRHSWAVVPLWWRRAALSAWAV